MKKLVQLYRIVCYYSIVLRPLLRSPMELNLIRHAESERNVVSEKEFNRVRKIPDHKVPITKNGRSQSFDSGKGIVNNVKSPDIIVTSGWKRTVQTLESLIDGMDNAWSDIPIEHDWSLRERENGYSWTYSTEQHDELFPFIPENWNVTGPALSRPFGGESIIDIIEKRLFRFIDDMSTKYAGKKVCLVVHGRVISGIRSILNNYSLDEIENLVSSRELGPKNLGLTQYKYNPWSGKLEEEFYNKVFY